MDKRPSDARRRALRLGPASAIYTLAVIAALVIINVLGVRYQKTWDLTPTHQYTLSQSTRKILGEIHQKVQILAFMQPSGTLTSQVMQLLKEYRQEGGGNISVQQVDPSAHPTLARENNVIEYNTVVVNSGKGHASATPADFYTYSPTGSQVFNGESAITNAIIRAVNPQRLKLYFTSGDGEHQLGGNYATISEELAAQGYRTASLDLLKTSTIPKDAAALVIAGPTHDLAKPEIAQIQAYAKRGGHVMVLLDPTVKGPLTNLYAMLTGWGVTPRNVVVVDPTSHYSTDPTVPIPNYVSDAITDPLTLAHEAAVMPAALSLQIAKNPSFVAKAFLKTSNAAYGHADLSGQSIAYAAGKDIKGPLTLGVTLTSDAKQSGTPSASAKKLPTQGFRAVVFGSSTFAQDRILTVSQGNSDLFLNAVGWLTGRAQGIAIRPNAAFDTRIFLSSGTTRGLFYGFVVLLPLVALLVGAAVWNSRRSL